MDQPADTQQEPVAAGIAVELDAVEGRIRDDDGCGPGEKLAGGPDRVAILCSMFVQPQQAVCRGPEDAVGCLRGSLDQVACGPGTWDSLLK